MFDIRFNSILTKAACFLLFICFAIAVVTTISTRKVEAIKPNSANSAAQGFSTTAQSKGKVNGKIVFTSDRGRKNALTVWTMNADGSNPTQLTDIPTSSTYVYDVDPKWSPDGMKIAFRSYGRGGYHSLFVMNADGTDLREVVINSSPEIGSFEWSPDGTKFLFDAGSYVELYSTSPSSDKVRPSGLQANIYIADIDGKNLIRLTNDAEVMNLSASWSPDGKSIAFVSNPAYGPVWSNIYVMNSDGTNRHVVATGFDPSWTPDGSKVLFVGAGNLYLVRPDGSALTQLTNYSAYYRRPVYSPDGTKIIFEREFSHYQYNSNAIFVMDADGNNQIDFSNRELGSSVFEGNPDWQALSTPPNNPPPSVLGFTNRLYLTTCKDTDIGVKRTGNLNQTVSAAYQIQIGTLTSAPVSLSFAPGEISQNVRVYGTCDVSFSTKVTLSNNAGNVTFVGGIKTATVVFGGSIANPIDNSAFFVMQQYHDFLDREPDSWGWDFWTNNIDTGINAGTRAGRRVDTSAAFFLSVEFQQTGYLVYRIYKAAYGNLPVGPVPIKLSDFLSDTQQVSQGVVVGQADWEQALETNKQKFFLNFVQRSQFTLAYPTFMTPVQFVDALFANAGVIPTVSERESAIGEFNSATGSADNAARARALRRVAENQTLAQQEFNRAFVLMQYFGYLRRDPNSGPDANFDGYNFWLNKLNQFNGDYNRAEMVKAFIGSGEYRQRFGP